MDRPDLTWRDIQHLCVYSAAKINPDDPDWDMTSSGRPFSYKYGFGKLDAYAYVTMARTWQLVKPQVWMDIAPVEFADAAMDGDELIGGAPIVPGGVNSSTVITREMLEEWNFEKLEHITVKVWIKHTRRGDVEVDLISPAGIRSVLASARRLDTATTGFVGWRFMTLKHWYILHLLLRNLHNADCRDRDEDPVGTWTLRVSDQSNNERGNFLGWSMTMWGSAVDPTLAEKYEIPDEPNEGHRLPPHPTSTETTKHHPKPTAHLPEDHASASGEATRPAFQTEETSGTATYTDIPTPFPDAAEEGIFNNMYNLLANQLWLIGAFGVVIIFGVGACAFFWLRKRRARRAKNAYAPIPGDNMVMRPIDRGGGAPSGTGAPGAGERTAGGTRELYDAFGVGSDEEDEEQDVDENTALTGGAARRFGQSAAPLAYHDGFLDDGGAPTARTAPAPYRDEEPEPTAATVALSSRQSPVREGSEGSGDGSWQDAGADHQAAPLRP